VKPTDLKARIRRRKRWDVVFTVVGIVALMIGVLTFVALFADMAIKGLGRIDADFFTSFPSRRAGSAGILSAWVGSTLVMIVTALVAVPLGVGAGIYLEEYARKNWVTDLIEINITNLAGVPSIVYGLLALGLFVYQFGLGQSILTAGLTLALLILPVVIVATREAIRSIPQIIREGSYACGATQWQTDVQLDLAARSCVPGQRGGRGLRPRRHDAGDERRGDLAALSPATQHQVVRDNHVRS
jgi:phosphate transport system permease protein